MPQVDAKALLSAADLHWNELVEHRVLAAACGGAAVALALRVFGGDDKLLLSEMCRHGARDAPCTAFVLNFWPAAWT